MGEDFWSYGIEPNRKTLETFLRHHHAQGLSSRAGRGRGAVPPVHARNGRIEGLRLRTRELAETRMVVGPAAERPVELAVGLVIGGR